MLLGHAAICIWNGIEAGFDASFCDWHCTEHMPERLSIPGFLRGRRYISDENEYFTLYELSSVDMLTSEHYLTRLNMPTQWTLESIKHFTNSVGAESQVHSTMEESKTRNSTLCAIAREATALAWAWAWHRLGKDGGQRGLMCARLNSCQIVHWLLPFARNPRC